MNKTPNDAARDRLIAQVRAVRGDLRRVAGPAFFLSDLAEVLGFDSLADLLGPQPTASDGRATVSAPPPLELFEVAEADDSGPCLHKRTEMTYPNNKYWVTCLDCGDVISGITG